MQSSYKVGLYYEFGQGVDKNAYIAFDYYQKAAAFNHKPSIYRLAYMLENGIGCQKDLVQANNYYQKAKELTYKK